MPELPEVQTVVSDLNRKVRGRKITGVWSDWPKVVKDPLDQRRIKPPHDHLAVFERAIRGEKILEARRRGKNILIYLTGGKLLLIHQKMTGHLLVGKWKISKSDKGQVTSNKEDLGSDKRHGTGDKVVPLEPEAVVTDKYNSYIHLLFYLDNGKMLALSDLRKFAKAILGKREAIENLPELKELGPDPFDPALTLEKFSEILRKKPGRIKQVLMDQTVLSGIGNIYSDDILWTAKIHPLRKIPTLRSEELKRIYQAMKKVLEKAVRLRGTSTSDFRDTAGKEGKYTDYRLVYQREGELCRRCGTKIQRLKVGGRSAHYCPACQKLK